MNKALILLATTSLLGGCASAPPDWLTGKRECNYIGCETGELQWYPNEDFASQRQARRWYGFDWADHSSRYHPSTPEYKERRAKEIERMQQMGLDPWGRPLK